MCNRPERKEANHSITQNMDWKHGMKKPKLRRVETPPTPAAQRDIGGMNPGIYCSF